MTTVELHNQIKDSILNYIRDCDLIKVVISCSHKRRKLVKAIPIDIKWKEYEFNILSKSPIEVDRNDPNYISVLDLLAKLRSASNDKGRTNKHVKVILDYVTYEVVSCYYKRYSSREQYLYLNVL